MMRLHLLMHGRVQGVFYRAKTLEQARRLHLTGWVRNCPNGDVEVVAEGTEDALEQLSIWCHRGPPLAKVAHVSTSWEVATGEFGTFQIIG